ncbi:cysteine three histidine 1 [Brachionichthys hirsutus]|uniref:cysteine three histidine 1 n=1 Tax=Brachionichthys hirsutus TaxID=412623 RepID=UPI003604FAAA
MVDSLLLDEEPVDGLLMGGGPEAGGGTSLAKALLPVASPPPPPAPWVCSTRYKTELCSGYSAAGCCKYAERCQFAHGLHELHVPFRHPKYKTELCRSYHVTGYCYYGNRCLFVHSPAEQRPPQRRRRNVPCRTFCSFGVCPFGTRCNFLHVDGGESPDGAGDKAPPPPSPRGHPQGKAWPPRGALCHTFSSFGFCLYGTRCRFQHVLPSKVKTPEVSKLTGGSSGLPSPTSASPLVGAPAHDAFTFSSQHLSDLLLPLALHLRQLESSKAQEIWDNRAL